MVSAFLRQGDSVEPIDPIEARVLGALLEKEAATPEYYPLSLNALVAACNQKSNRIPVVSYTERDVLEAVARLQHRRWAATIVGNGRVDKYAQRISETLNLGRREIAVLSVLLLRGPQTLAEIKDRAERMHSFAALEEVERVLQKLTDWPSGSLARNIGRAPGQKEARYAQLLTGEPVTESPTVEAVPASLSGSRAAQLEAEVASMREELADLRRRLEVLESVLR